MIHTNGNNGATQFLTLNDLTIGPMSNTKTTREAHIGIQFFDEQQGFLVLTSSVVHPDFKNVEA